MAVVIDAVGVIIMSDYAVMLNGGTDDIGQTANGLEYAIDLDESGFDVELYFDGESTNWPGLLHDKPDHPVNKFYEEAHERGLIGGACSYCANAFGGTEGCERAGVELLGNGEHAPDVGELAADGTQLITVG